MRPTTPEMQAACAAALDQYQNSPDPGCEAWMVRFAATVTADKVHATCARVDEWFNANDATAGAVAWGLLGGDAGQKWAKEAYAAAPQERAQMSTLYDQIEAEADERELLTAAAEFDDRKPEWVGVLGLEGVATSDNRIITPGGLTWRELPVPLMDQLESQPGHDGAVAVGPITNIYRNDVVNGMSKIMGEGLFDSGDEGKAARARVQSGSKMGVSLDLVEVVLDLPEDEDDLFEILMGGGELRISSAVIAAATLVAIPAFADARLQIAGDIPADVDPAGLVASGGRLDGIKFTVVTPIEFTVEQAIRPVEWAAVSVLPAGTYPADDGLYEIDEEPAGADLDSEVVYSTEHLDALVASGATHRPPSGWFSVQRYSGPTAFVVEEPDDTGLRRFHGHLGIKGSCHIGFESSCVDVPMGLDYDSFQGDRAAGIVRCSDGVTVNAGPIVMSTEHAAIRDAHGRNVPAGRAVDHYAHTGCVVGQGRCYEDRFGVQIQGWILPDVTDSQLARLDAVDLSPDWRPRATARGGRGVVGVLAVPVSGFNTALAASASSGDTDVTAEFVVVDWESDRDEAGRKVAALSAIGVTPPTGLVAAATAVDPPEMAARKAAAIAVLNGEHACGCGGDCCGT